MSKFLTLTKMLFLQQYKAKPTGDKKKKGNTVALWIVLGVCFAPLLALVGFAAYSFGAIIGAEVSVGLEMMILVSQGMVLLFGVPAVINNVYSPKDADKLLYLPIKTSTVFFSKITVVYLDEVLTTALTVLVLLLPFGIGAGMGAGYFVLLVPAVFLIPLLPMLLAAIVSMPFCLLINKIGKNGTLHTLFQILLFVVIMGAYFLFMYRVGYFTGSTGGDFEQIFQNLLDGVKPVLKYIHPNHLFAQSMTATAFGTGLLNLLGSVGEFAVLVAILFAISVPFYRSMLSSGLESGGQKRKKIKTTIVPTQYKKQGVLRQLIATDFKRTLRDNQLGFQSFAVTFMLPLIVVVLGFSFSQVDESGVSVLDEMMGSSVAQLIAVFAILAYMMLLSGAVNSLALYPITRENNNLFALKVYPVPFKTILTAKVILASLVMLVSDVITAVLLMIMFKITWYRALLMLLELVLFGFGSSCITTRYDLKHPKIGWSNFQRSLKNATNAWIAMLIGLILATVFIIALVILLVCSEYVTNLWPVELVLWILLTAVGVGYSLVTYNILYKRADELFAKIEL